MIYFETNGCKFNPSMHSYHVLSMIESTEVQSLVFAVDDDIHHGADLGVGDVISALATFPQPHLKALQCSETHRQAAVLLTLLQSNMTADWPMPMSLITKLCCCLLVA